MQNGKGFAAMQVWRRPDGSSNWTRVGVIQNRTSVSEAPTITVNTTGFSDWTVSDQSNPLPVTLSSFTARRAGAEVVSLSWTTSQELNNKGFVLERSEDNLKFDSLGWIAGAGTTAQKSKYDYLDRFAASVYYRLTQVDADGNRTILPTVYAHAAGKQNGIDAYLDGRLLHVNGMVGAYDLRVLDASAKLVYSTTASAGQETITLPAALPQGVYQVQLQGTQQVEMVKVVVW
jgi:hypothetical protein